MRFEIRTIVGQLGKLTNYFKIACHSTTIDAKRQSSEVPTSHVRTSVGLGFRGSPPYQLGLELTAEFETNAL